MTVITPPVDPPADVPDESGPEPLARALSRWKRHRRSIVVAVVVTGIIGAATAVGLWASRSPDPNEVAVRQWADNGGAYHWNNVRGGMAAFADLDGTNDNSQHACENLATVVGQAQRYDPIPDPVAQRHWSASLIHLGAAVSTCSTAGGDPDLNSTEWAKTELQKAEARLDHFGVME